MKIKLFFSTIILAAVATSTATIQVSAQNNAYEDEWYDPTDWFDGNNYEYDDTLGLDYDTNYDYGFGDVYDHGYTDLYDNDTEYGWHYDWDSNQNSWVSDYGWYDSYYDYDDNSASASKQRNQRQNQSANRQQQANQSRQDRQSQQASNQQQNQQRNQSRVLRGQVDSWSYFTLRDRQGRGAKHTVVRMNLQNGRTVLVDLGRYSASPNNLQLHNGDNIVVKGSTGTIDGRRVLMADSVRLDGQTFTINRNSSQGRSQMSQNQQQSGNRNIVTFSGNVDNVQQVQVNQGGQRKTLVKVDLSDGRSTLLDLGSNTSLSDLDIDQDDPITVRGWRDYVNGRYIIRATQIRVDGQQTQLSQASQQRSR